ncbi:hypothetical protein AWB74_02212 [Caballeronia arvi]|uniref:DUF5672 domain-containing protein n=1 Tax=Caballeronia arvi TaxID=1777135 RepID=A0A158HW92_9BURK|nr:DUF5672 family protein [Caballeronia arvi]SAL48353.1 hypothetical protein AWB74_02212 [Caballeronia arvi]
MLFALWRFIETEYALIVQDDGWILDIGNWSDEFLSYDYIGAPIISRGSIHRRPSRGCATSAGAIA